MSHKDPDVDLASVSSKVILSDLLLKENATVSKTMNIQLITKHYCRLAETIHHLLILALLPTVSKFCSCLRKELVCVSFCNREKEFLVL